MSKVKLATLMFDVRTAMKALRLRANHAVFGAIGFAAKGRWALTILVTAVIGSYLAPIALTRYQRSVAIRDDAARLCDQLIRTQAELEASVDTYRMAQEAYWRRVFNRQLIRARLRVTTSQWPAETLRAQADAEGEAITEARDDLRDARHGFQKHYAAFYVWRIEGALRFENLFPKRQRDTRQALQETGDRLNRVRVRFDDREIGFRVTESLREHALTQLTDAFSNGAIAVTKFEATLAKGSVTFGDDSILDHNFTALSSLARRLSREETDEQASLVHAPDER